ncbi:MAG TPA: hypothetical protein V6C91_04790 [Coleofasciculaceae cyanobacterium]
MHTSRNIQVGDQVLILNPAYVAGKIGVVCSREVQSGGQFSDRWLIRVISEDIIVSLTPDEFQVLHFPSP